MTTSSQLSPEDVREMLARLDEQLRDEKRARERVSRERRVARLEVMRAQVRALGQVALTLPLVSDADEIWDEFLDADAKRIRGLLRQLSPAVQQVHTLIQEKEELQRQLQEHEASILAIRKMLEHDATDGWQDDVCRWRALTRMAFKPLSVDQCVREVEAAMRAMESAKLLAETRPMGASFLGWEESRTLAHVSSHGATLDFHLQKTYHGCNLDRITELAWRAFTDQSLFADVVHGGKSRAALDIVQEVSPTMLIVQLHERHDDAAHLTFHSLVLLARVETQHGATQVLRSLEAPEIHHAISGPGDLWSTPSVWIDWHLLDTSKPRTATDLVASLGGTLRGDVSQYAQRWSLELIGALVRAEAAITGKPLVDLSSSS